MTDRMSRTPVESTTAIPHGGGRPHRWVSGLTNSERDALRQRSNLVYFRGPNTHYTQTGYKVCTYYKNQFGFREPTPTELEYLNSWNTEKIC